LLRCEKGGSSTCVAAPDKEGEDYEIENSQNQPKTEESNLYPFQESNRPFLQASQIGSFA